MPDVLIPFMAETVWHQGKPLHVAEPSSTIGLLISATIKLIVRIPPGHKTA
jgi:hypothetical protein